MIESIEANSYMSTDVEKWLDGMKSSFVGDKISKKSTENAFTVFHCASANGVLLQCQVNWRSSVLSVARVTSQSADSNLKLVIFTPKLPSHLKTFRESFDLQSILGCKSCLIQQTTPIWDGLP
jgi:hypothetical protein